MSNFAQLSEGDGTIFLVRWRGRQEGPYAGPVIEAKLASNEIGLLHEIYYEGKWITIREYIANRKGILRTELEAKEAHAQKLKDDADRKAKEREEMRRAEALAEEKLKNIRPESDTTRENSKQPLNHPVTPASEGGSGLRIFGIILLIIGLAVTGFFFLAYDTSVDSGFGRVNNFGLMADRQNGIIIGIGLCVIGPILVAIASRGKN